jgi:hypothetical protein
VGDQIIVLESGELWIVGRSTLRFMVTGIGSPFPGVLLNPGTCWRGSSFRCSLHGNTSLEQSLGFHRVGSCVFHAPGVMKKSKVR